MNQPSTPNSLIDALREYAANTGYRQGESLIHQAADRIAELESRTPAAPVVANIDTSEFRSVLIECHHNVTRPDKWGPLKDHINAQLADAIKKYSNQNEVKK